MGERESPETEIRSGIGDGSQHKLDCLYQLVNNDVCRFTMTIFLLRLILKQCLCRVRINKLFFMMISFVLFINIFVSVLFCSLLSLFNILKGDLFQLLALLVV